MIQELLGGGGGGVGGVGEERKISMNGGGGGGGGGGGTVEGSSSSSSSSDHQNLRCPRCDSSNTKFCYYNNYNLTQPRHFCKTCRRYWTKGGALRNVPIGGGCRKNKSASVATSSGGKSGTGKAKSSTPEVGKPNSGSGFDHELPSSNPVLWAPHHNSQLLAMLRASQNPNPNPNSVMIKEEKVMIGSHMAHESSVATGALNARNLGVDPLTQIPIGLSSSFWRNNHQHHHHQQQQQQQLLQNHPQQHSMLMGEVPNTGFQDIYHRLRSTANLYSDHSPMALNGSTASSTSSILEPVVGGSQLGYWNSPFSWSDLPTTNGAFP